MSFREEHSKWIIAPNNFRVTPFPDPIRSFGPPGGHLDFASGVVFQAVRRCRRWTSAPGAARLVFLLILFNGLMSKKKILYKEISTKISKNTKEYFKFKLQIKFLKINYRLLNLFKKILKTLICILEFLRHLMTTNMTHFLTPPLPPDWSYDNWTAQNMVWAILNQLRLAKPLTGARKTWLTTTTANNPIGFDLKAIISCLLIS